METKRGSDPVNRAASALYKGALTASAPMTSRERSRFWSALAELAGLEHVQAVARMHRDFEAAALEARIRLKSKGS